MMSDEERTRERCLPAPTSKSRGSTAGGRGFKSDSTCRRQNEQRGMRQRAAAKAHAMQGSSLPDAAAAAAFDSSAAAHQIKTVSAGRTSRAATSAGRTRPANEVRQRQHARAQHCMRSSDVCSLAQQQQQQQGSRSAATAAKCAAELGGAYLGRQRADGREAPKEERAKLGAFL